MKVKESMPVCVCDVREVSESNHTFICCDSFMYSTSATGGCGLTTCSTLKWEEPCFRDKEALLLGWLYISKVGGDNWGSLLSSMERE